MEAKHDEAVIEMFRKQKQNDRQEKDKRLDALLAFVVAALVFALVVIAWWNVVAWIAPDDPKTVSRSSSGEQTISVNVFLLPSK